MKELYHFCDEIVKTENLGAESGPTNFHSEAIKYEEFMSNFGTNQRSNGLETLRGTLVSKNVIFGIKQQILLS